jgi:hypothetical protein
MPAQLPYLSSNKNVPVLFNKITSAKIPDKFTHEFLQKTIGLTSTNDRSLIPLLRNLGFLDQSSTPTVTYRLLKGEQRPGAIAEGIRNAYQPLFDADTEAYELSGDRLKSLIAQVAGTDDDMTARISSTFTTLVKLGDFKAAIVAPEKEKKTKHEPADESDETDHGRRAKGSRTEFHYNIQVQLPSNGTEETYLNIFNALRKTFQ